MGNDDIQEVWNRYLQEVELASNYHMPYALDGFGTTFRNPLLDFLLPSLLYVKLASILDQALVSYMGIYGLKLPVEGFNKSLEGRLTFLNDQNLIHNYLDLDRIRKNRNGLAHQSSAVSGWTQLKEDLDIVEEELRQLGVVDERPEYQYFGERSKMRAGNQPGVDHERDFRFGVKRGDKVVMQFSFIQQILADDARNNFV